MQKTRFSINLKDGRLVFRNDEVDAQITYHPIPNDVAVALSKGKVTTKQVINACERKLKERGEMSYQEYLKKQQLLNVRQKDIEPPKSRPKAVETRADELISLADVGLGSKPVKEKKKVKSTPSVEEKPTLTLNVEEKTEKKHKSLNF